MIDKKWLQSDVELLRFCLLRRSNDDSALAEAVVINEQFRKESFELQELNTEVRKISKDVDLDNGIKKEKLRELKEKKRVLKDRANETEKILLSKICKIPNLLHRGVPQENLLLEEVRSGDLELFPFDKGCFENVTGWEKRGVIKSCYISSELPVRFVDSGKDCCLFESFVSPVDGWKEHLEHLIAIKKLLMDCRVNYKLFEVGCKNLKFDSARQFQIEGGNFEVAICICTDFLTRRDGIRFGGGKSHIIAKDNNDNGFCWSVRTSFTKKN